MNRIQTLKSNYKVTFKAKGKVDSDFFFEDLKSAKEFRELLAKDTIQYEKYPELIMLSSGKKYDVISSVYKDKWI